MSLQLGILLIFVCSHVFKSRFRFHNMDPNKEFVKTNEVAILLSLNISIFFLRDSIVAYFFRDNPFEKFKQHQQGRCKKGTKGHL